jgi:hypothetical protein
MSYIFNFRYKPSTNIGVLNEFIKIQKLRWKSRKIMLNGDIYVKFVSAIIDVRAVKDDIQKIKDTGVSIDSIECDNGEYISICTDIDY